MRTERGTRRDLEHVPRITPVDRVDSPAIHDQVQIGFACHYEARLRVRPVGSRAVIPPVHPP
jgi:hypothetical protein